MDPNDDQQGREMDLDHAAMTRERRRRQKSSTVEMSLVAGAAILIAVSTMFSAWNAFELRKINRTEMELRTLLLRGTECLVEQMAEHRHLNALAHRTSADEHGYSYPIPPEEEPPPVPGKLEESCATFIATTTSTVGRP